MLSYHSLCDVLNFFISSPVFIYFLCLYRSGLKKLKKIYSLLVINSHKLQGGDICLLQIAEDMLKATSIKKFCVINFV